MEIGISTASYFNRMPIEDAVGDIRRQGAWLCELFLDTFCEYTPEFAALLQERATAAGVRISSVHPMSIQFESQLFSIHPRQYADAWKIYETVLQSAKTLGAPVYVMHGPPHLSGYFKNVQIERIAPIFFDLCAMARAYGVTLALENVSWCLFQDPAFGARLLDAVGVDALHFTLDVKQAYRSGFTPMEFVERFGENIVNLHLCDVQPLTDGRVRPVLPGSGICDFAALTRRLVEKGYRGPAIIELYSDMYDDFSALSDVRAYLASILPSD